MDTNEQLPSWSLGVVLNNNLMQQKQITTKQAVLMALYPWKILVTHSYLYGHYTIIFSISLRSLAIFLVLLTKADMHQSTESYSATSQNTTRISKTSGLKMDRDCYYISRAHRVPQMVNVLLLKGSFQPDATQASQPRCLHIIERNILAYIALNAMLNLVQVSCTACIASG